MSPGIALEHGLQHLRLARRRVVRLPHLGSLLVASATGAAALLAADLIVDGYGPLLLTAAAALIGLAIIVARPDLVLLGWVVLLVGAGRDFSHFTFGPLYVSELLIAGLVLSIALRWVFGERLPDGVKAALGLAGLMLTAAMGSLLLYTNLSSDLWMREFAIVHYSVAAVIGAYFMTKPGFAKRLLYALLIGSVIGVVWALYEYSQGHVNITSTGAIRIAPIQFAIAFGVTPLVLMALVRERLARPFVLLALAPFLVCLLLVNHRSAWIGFAAAVALLLGARRSASGRLALLAAAGGALVVMVSVYVVAPRSDLGAAVARGLTITETKDPNAEYRLDFWKAVFRKGIESPIGAGFDPYPREWVPVNTVPGEEKNPAPHNSWVALLYRIGPIFLTLVLAILWTLGVRAVRLEESEPDPGRKVLLAVLGASLAYLVVVAFFNAALEVPYIAVPFWLLVGFLAATVFDRREAPASADLAQPRSS